MSYHSYSVPDLTEGRKSAQQVKLEKQVRTVYELAERLYERCADACDACIQENLGLCMQETRGMVFVFETDSINLGEDYLMNNYLDVLIKLEMNLGSIKKEVIPYDGLGDFEECMVLLQLLIIAFKSRKRKR